MEKLGTTFHIEKESVNMVRYTHVKTSVQTSLCNPLNYGEELTAPKKL